MCAACGIVHLGAPRLIQQIKEHGKFVAWPCMAMQHRSSPNCCVPFFCIIGSSVFQPSILNPTCPKDVPDLWPGRWLARVPVTGGEDFPMSQPAGFFWRDFGCFWAQVFQELRHLGLHARLGYLF